MTQNAVSANFCRRAGACAPKVTMEMEQATYDELLTLSETIGYPPEARSAMPFGW